MKPFCCGDGGIEDQYINSAKIVNGGFDNFVCGILVANVAIFGNGRTLEFRDLLNRLISGMQITCACSVSIIHDYLCASCGKL